MSTVFDSRRELENYAQERGFDPSEIHLNTGKIHRFKRNGKKTKDAWSIGWSYSQ